MCSTHSVTFLKPTTNEDSSAGFRYENWTPVEGLENRSCTIQTASGRDLQQWGQRQIKMSHVVYFVGTEILSQIQRHWVIRDDSNSQIYLLKAYLDEAGRGELTSVVVHEWKG